ncbi:helix-turn-helix domain-containing protein [Brachybacterium sp. EF45031]|uniref:ArsR family transcriptional regulator n=1 Tax=Brachybacterium sillae TaxID=2810536 RepID=UPI00217D5466|nr:helix-turn-helix domain-containing protein [Brachybacterium sillae]MCS6712530.1 helix-turn-helix domain-containing protein [Brachybacterium sillae]
MADVSRPSPPPSHQTPSLSASQPEPAQPPTDPPKADLVARIERLEALVTHLADHSGTTGSATASARASDPSIADPAGNEGLDLWAVDGLRDRSPEGGALYAGSVTTPAGAYVYQWARPTRALLDADWAERAERLAALGQPLRLSILRLLLDGPTSVAQIVDQLQLGSTGVAYHHLHALQSEGWVTSPQRGVWEIPPARVVPLLVIMLAVEP